MKTLASAIEYPTRSASGGLDGTLALLRLKTAITIAPNKAKLNDRQADSQVTVAGEIEIGTRWIREGKRGGMPFISLSIAAPELGSLGIYANLSPAAGKSEREFVLLWNPAN